LALDIKFLDLLKETNKTIIFIPFIVSHFELTLDGRRLAVTDKEGDNGEK
jgi:hypothetical protein